MFKVRCRERTEIDRFRCVDREKEFTARSFFKGADSSVWYFNIDRFNIKTVSEDDIISIYDTDKGMDVTGCFIKDEREAER